MDDSSVEHITYDDARIVYELSLGLPAEEQLLQLCLLCERLDETDLTTFFLSLDGFVLQALVRTLTDKFSYDEHIFRTLIGLRDESVTELVCASEHLTYDIAWRVYDSEKLYAGDTLRSDNPNFDDIPADVRQKVINKSVANSSAVRELALNPNIPEDMLWVLADLKSFGLNKLIVSNPTIPHTLLQQIIEQDTQYNNGKIDIRMSLALLTNPALTKEMVDYIIEATERTGEDGIVMPDDLVQTFRET